MQSSENWLIVIQDEVPFVRVGDKVLIVSQFGSLSFYSGQKFFKGKERSFVLISWV